MRDRDTNTAGTGFPQGNYDEAGGGGRRSGAPMMQAVISGQAGVALLFEGERLSSVHADNLEQVIGRREREVPYLLGSATDLEFIEDITLPEVTRSLRA